VPGWVPSGTADLPPPAEGLGAELASSPTLRATERPRRRGRIGQAASIHLFAFYLGSSIFGSLTGRAWTVGTWPAVVLLASALFLASGLLAMWLRHTPSLDPLRR
jgi:surface polysaccharide O-acyltransferase-like enzyme